MSYQRFSEVYKSWTDLELFQLLQHKEDYQEEAVEAATAEINSRKLSETELAALLKTYQEKQFKKQNTRKRKFVRTVEARKGKLIEDLNPFSEKTTNRQIRLLCYALTFIILCSFPSDYRSTYSILRHGWLDSSIILPLVPYLFVPVGIFYFWRRQKFGWSILTIWFVLSSVMIITSYIWELRAANDQSVERFFPRQGISHYLLSLLFFGGLLVYINTKKITEAFNIDNKFRSKVGVLAILYALFNLAIVFL